MKFVHTADTHLGFEITRINQSDPQGRRKRADHIFRNFLAVLDHTRDVEADLLIHSGDLFNKYYLPREILDELVQPIFELAKSGKMEDGRWEQKKRCPDSGLGRWPLFP